MPRALLKGSLGSQTKQPPASSLRLPGRGQEHPAGGPGRRLGLRGQHHHPQRTANVSRSSPLRQRGCKRAPADAANRASITHFTPPPLLPKTKHTPRNRRKPVRKNPTVIQQLFQAFSFPGGGCSAASPPRRPGPARCPVATGARGRWTSLPGPFSPHLTPCASQLAFQREGDARFLSAEPMHLEMHDDFSRLIGNTAWVLQSQE